MVNICSLYLFIRFKRLIFKVLVQSIGEKGSGKSLPSDHLGYSVGLN